MSGFALLWSRILDSSLWVKESKETRLVWITLLAMRDSEGRVMCSVVGLADRAKVTVEECRKAIVVLEGPDEDDSSGVEGGRRIRRVEGGWEIVNHDRYRFSTEAKREFWRQQKAEQRNRGGRGKGKGKKGWKNAGLEREYGEAYKEGDEARCDEIAARGLPGGSKIGEVSE